MNSAPLFRFFAGLCLVAPLVHAQQALYAEHNGKFHLVRQVVRSDPYVDDGSGKLVPASGTKFGLSSAPEFAPYYVSVRRLKVETRGLELIGSGAEINREFSFRADFESGFRLKNVFVVLDMNSEDAGKTMFVREVGDLEPRELKAVQITVRLNQRMGAGRYRLHVFSDGMEVFHSEMPLTFIESKLDQIVRRQVKDAPDGPPKPLVGPVPEYPDKERRGKISGAAKVRFTISQNGRVRDLEMVSATLPAFGEAALAAARLWRFLPKIKDGQPVTSIAELPFTFGLPQTPK